MAQLQFEEWYNTTLEIYKTKFKELPLDEDAARDAYNDGLSPEEYITELENSID